MLRGEPVLRSQSLFWWGQELESFVLPVKKLSSRRSEEVDGLVCVLEKKPHIYGRGICLGHGFFSDEELVPLT